MNSAAETGSESVWWHAVEGAKARHRKGVRDTASASASAASVEGIGVWKRNDLVCKQAAAAGAEAMADATEGKGTGRME